MSVEQRIYDMSLEAAVRDLSADHEHGAVTHGGYQFHVMKGSGTFGCDYAGAADEDSVGILQNKPEGEGHESEIRRVGISKAVCGDTIPVWSKVTPDGNSHIVVALAGERYVGLAMQPGIDTRVISILMEFGVVEAEAS